MQTGDYVKVSLPGETPWAEVLAVEPGGFVGRIANKLFTEYSDQDRQAWCGEEFGIAAAEPLPRLHDFKQDQVVTFERGGHMGREWVPAQHSAGGRA